MFSFTGADRDGDTFEPRSCFENVFNRRKHSRPFSLSSGGLCLLGLLALGAPGCLLAIDGSEIVDDDVHQDSHRGRDRESPCERARSRCLARAGDSTRFQKDCHEAYRACIGLDSESTDSSRPGDCEDSDSDSPGDCPGSESSSGESTEPQYPEDPDWEVRCNSIETACKDACDDPGERARCEQWGQQCKNTRCGIEQRCSTQSVEAPFSQCGLGHRGCAEGARNDEERALCSGSFRLCAKAVPGFESLDQTNGAVLSACLDQHARCQRSSATPELQGTCATMLRACLKPW